MEILEILGTADDAAFADRTHCRIDINWGDARKHRQLVKAEDGREIAVRLPRGTFLADGLVLWDDGTEIGVVRRPKEHALVLDFEANAGHDGVRRALLLGYLLGNQHAPLEVSHDQLRTPLMTGRETALATLRQLGLTGDVREVELAARGWTNTSADHHEGHRHD